MLSGTFPFPRIHSGDYCVAIETGRVRRIDHVVPGVSRRVADVVHRALAYDPDDRYRDAGEMLAALHEAVRSGISSAA